MNTEKHNDVPAEAPGADSVAPNDSPLKDSAELRDLAY